MKRSQPPCILYISSFPPRECGIATFTQDLTNAIDKEFNPEIKSKVCALNYNGTSIYNYPRKVIMQINESEMEDYVNRALEINKSPHIKAVNIQHEYGLFGGDWGDYLLPFMELINKPIILTMHTVLPKPEEKLKKVTLAITEKADRVIVMTKTMRNLLNEEYHVKSKKITVIPHGVHHIAFPSKTRAKKKLNLSGRTIISTFGMLNRDKGIEYAIEALPQVVQEFPDVLYLILGATHPLIVKQEGERYRNKLKKIIHKHKLQDNVKFYDKYLDLNELIDFLRATDIYISPTLNPLQAVSGTISYALSCACPIIATKNQYAKDTIDSSRGSLVRFRKSGDIKNALLDILSDPQAQKEMKKNAYFYSRHMTWQNVALSYFNIFNGFAKILPKDKSKFPPINLGHIKSLTDTFGMIQFANHTKPDPQSGYCLDDNARALLGFSKMYEKKRLKSTLNYIKVYLDFIEFTQKKNGKFYNFVTYNRDFNDNGESEDSFGRAIWSLGVIIKNPNIDEKTKHRVIKIFNKTKDAIPELHSLRAVSFSIIGLCQISRYYESLEENGDEKIIEENNTINELITTQSDKLVECFEYTKENSNDFWEWFEDCLTYSNYKLPEALLRAYKQTDNKKYKIIAEKSLDFINSITFEKENYFAPIGQDGWFFRNGKRAYFDQQPEDAASAVEALAVAYKITGDKNYKDKAELTFQWFLGKNHLNQMVYDEATGGCYDGIGKYSLNFNQGAESTLSYFLARLAIENI